MYRVGLISLSLSAFALPSYASDLSENDAKKLLSLSLAELSNIIVTSVSKKEEPENEAPSAIFVITQEDIKRSGAVNIPEALRGVPGITVTQAGSSNWTVTSRGFNSQFSNKLLVLMDGRTIYSPLFSGVIWDSQDTMMEDIERIEIIRGPGATLWGANAVNGVINIITKNSKDTVGGLAAATYGNKVGSGAIRHGVKVGDDSYFRTYAKYNDYASQHNTDGTDAGDSWRKQQAGFRSDIKISSRDTIKIQGDIYAADQDDIFIFPSLSSVNYRNSSKGYKQSGGNFILSWEQKQSKDSEISLQGYFDRAAQKTYFFNDYANTYDIEFQHTWTGWKGHEVIWGSGYRYINNYNDPSIQYELTPETRNDSLLNVFVQDKITILPKEVFLTLGSKFEHNDYSGFEIQPSARVSWLPSENQTIWASVSRAVRTASRFSADGRLSYFIAPPSISVPVPTLFTSKGNRDLEAETLIAYELGYRIQPMKTLSVDVTGYYNSYNDILRDTLGTPTFLGTYVNYPITVQNTNKADSLGFEASLKYNILSDWQLAGSYSYIDLTFSNKVSVLQPIQGRHPKHSFNIRSTYLFQNGLEMTNSIYSVSSLGSINIDAYTRLDTKFSYPLTESLDVSVVGQNLLDRRHKEFTPFLYQTQTEIGRSVYGSLAFKF